MDEHARDKIVRLVGDRYEEESDMLTIVVDRCPTKKQNYDYALYVLTALYHESNVCYNKKTYIFNHLCLKITLFFRPLKNGKKKNRKLTWNIIFGKIICPKRHMLHL